MRIFIKLKSNVDGTESFNLKQKKISNCAPYSDNLFDADDLVSRAYADKEIAKIPTVNTSDLLKLDGSRAMTGDLKMGDHTITGIKSSSSDNAALTVGGKIMIKYNWFSTTIYEQKLAKRRIRFCFYFI